MSSHLVYALDGEPGVGGSTAPAAAQGPVYAVATAGVGGRPVVVTGSDDFDATDEPVVEVRVGDLQEVGPRSSRT